MSEDTRTADAPETPAAPVIEVADYGDAYVFKGDCLASMQHLIALGLTESVHAIICDPPYGIGFMARNWDTPETIAFRPEIWSLTLQLLKPGGHLAAFGSPRTYHRLAVEDAGFEIRDSLMWIYGTGFPKNVDVSREIDRTLGAVREPKRIPYAEVGNLKARGDVRPFMVKAAELGYHEMPGDTPVSPEAAQWSGYGTALKPGHEPILLARKPLKGTIAQNVLAYGTGALNIDACRVGDEVVRARAQVGGEKFGRTVDDQGEVPRVVVDAGQRSRRHPANVVHDGGDAVVDAFASFAAPGQKAASRTGGDKSGSVYGKMGHPPEAMQPRGDTGTASRYFSSCGWSPEEEEDKLFHYSGKANKAERAGSSHPTQKPVALMRWLVRLLCPPDGAVFDPFSGSGTTLEAALIEGRHALGCEITPEYWPDIERRVKRALEATGREVPADEEEPIAA
jgi:DNA modification methylase